MSKNHDKNRARILDALLPIAAFEGWNSKSLRQAVRSAKLPPGSEDTYFPGGEIEAITFWSETCNAQVQAHFDGLDLADMRIRDKVTQGVWAYIEALKTHEDAARRAMARLSMLDAVGRGPKHRWATADTIWRAIGDTSTDINFYSKRAILSGVISSVFVKWLTDTDPDKHATRDFLQARIANVMSFEKAKFQFKNTRESWPSPASVLGRLRYGSRRRRRRS